MGWSDLPWGYIVRFALMTGWIALLVSGLVIDSVIPFVIAIIIVAVLLVHIIASTSRDYQDFIYKVQQWRENGGGR